MAMGREQSHQSIWELEDQLLLSDASILFIPSKIAFCEVATFFMSDALPPSRTVDRWLQRLSSSLR
jgi:hypothetical protein